MYVHPITIRLKNTDATGGIYFTELLKMAEETFESFLEEQDFPVQKLFSLGFGLPIVHAEADFIQFLSVGDKLEAQMQVSRIGTSSLTLSFVFLRSGIEVAKASLVHVAISTSSQKKIPLPSELIHLLSNLQPVS